MPHDEKHTIYQIRTANQVLCEGGVIAYPTEAVFGLGCDPMNSDAIKQLLHVKNRAMEKGLILIAAEFYQLEPFIDPLPTPLLNKVMETWPGPVNWLLPANPKAPRYLRGKHPLQAVRISNHPTVRALCQKFGGAIVSTSANLSKRPPARTSIQAKRQLMHKIDYVLHGHVGKLRQPCEIRNGLNDHIVRSAT